MAVSIRSGRYIRVIVQNLPSVDLPVYVGWTTRNGLPRHCFVMMPILEKDGYMGEDNLASIHLKQANSGTALAQLCNLPVTVEFMMILHKETKSAHLSDVPIKFSLQLVEKMPNGTLIPRGLAIIPLNIYCTKHPKVEISLWMTSCSYLGEFRESEEEIIDHSLACNNISSDNEVQPQ